MVDVTIQGIGAEKTSPVGTDTIEIQETAGGTSYYITLANLTKALTAVTVSAQGAMSASDKSKLDAIEASANNYSHPNHSGDVTSVGDGAQTIAANAVTYAKMQDVTATARVLGRKTAGAGDVEELSEADLKSTMNLEIGTDVQAYDDGLLSIAGLTTAANKGIYTTASDTYATYDLTAFARTFLDDADAAAVQATLGLVVGTDVQPNDATLTSIAALGTAADKFAYTTGIDTWAEAAITAAGRAILDDASASAQRTTLGLAIGSDVQAYDSALADIAGLTPSTNNTISWSGANWVASTVDSLVTSALITGKTLVTVASGDSILVSDASDSGNLKKVLASDLLSGSGDMLAATYDPAAIAEQLVGLTASQTLTNKTLTQPTITIKQGTAPTAEGDLQWNATNNTILVGDSVGTKVFSDDSTRNSQSATLTNKTIDGDNNTISNLDIGNEVDWAVITDVADRTAFASGDKLLIFEAGVGLRKIDYDDLPSGGSGASTALDNLASVAINTSLISDTDITDDLGSAAVRWKDIYAQTIGTGETAADTFTLRARDVDGASWTPVLTITANNTPTANLGSLVTYDSNQIVSVVSNAGDPNSTVTPDFAGQLCHDTTNDIIYIAVGTLNTDWKAGGLDSVTGTSGQIIVYNGSGAPTAVTMSGDATIAAGGAITIANQAVTLAMLDDTTLPGIQSIEGLGSAANKMLYTTGVDTYAEADITAGGRSLVGLAHNFAGTTAPTTTDDTGSGYGPGSIWVDTTNDKAYVCLDGTSTAAVWTETTQSGGSPSLASLSDTTITAAANGDFLMHNGTAWVDQTTAEVKATLSLNNVENTALSTWAGSANITTLGTIGTGTWQGTAVAVGYGGTGSGTAAGARTNLGLAIGSDVQAYNAGLALFAGVTHNFSATAAPTVNDDTTGGYGPGSVWIDTTNDKAYVCLDGTDTAAVWTETTGSGGASDHGALTGLTDDDHTQYSLISSGAGAPASTPSRVGLVYIDTTNDLAYFSTGTASSADWKLSGASQNTPTDYAAATIVGGDALLFGDASDSDNVKYTTVTNFLSDLSIVTSPEFSDNVFRINDNADATKQLAFEVSGITTATTRTWTVPDTNVTVTSFAATLLDDASAAAAATTLGLGTGNSPTFAGLTLSGAASFADNTLDQPVIQDYVVESTSPSQSAGTLTLDLANGNDFDVTLDGNVTTISVSNWGPTGTLCKFTLAFTQDATGSRTVTWPAAWKWVNGVADPTVTTTATTGHDEFVVWSRNGGTTVYAATVGQDFQ